MNLTPRELDKLLIYMMADVALKRKAKGIKLNHPETVALISAAVLDGAREGKTLEQVMTEGRTAVSAADVMDGVADLIPYRPAGGRVHRRQPPRHHPLTHPVSGGGGTHHATGRADAGRRLSPGGRAHRDQCRSSTDHAHGAQHR